MTQTQVTIPTTTLDKFTRLADLLEQASKLAYEIGRGKTSGNQEWYWSKTWQEWEKAADEDIASGRVKEFETVDELVADLNS